MLRLLQKLSYTGFVSILLVIASGLSSHVKAQEAMQVAKDNFTSFTPEKKYSNLNKLRLITSEKYQNHPDFGKCFTDSDSWYEQLDKRTLKTRSYVNINDPDEVIRQYAYDNLNYVDDNGWLCGVDTRLRQTSEGWAVKQQETPTYLHPDGSTAISLGHKQLMQFNKNVEFNNEPVNTSDFSVGDNGMMVKNAAKNTDKIIHFKRDEIETDYLINKPLKLSGDLLISEDIILPAGYSISEKTTNDLEESDNGSLEVIGPDGKMDVELKSPFCYDNVFNQCISSYRVHKQQGGYRLDIVVSSSWLNDPARKYPVTIDPLVIGTTTTWSGGVIDACYPPASTSGTGTGTIEVVVPADITITHFIVSGSYTTFKPKDSSGIAFYTRCGRTPTVGTFWTSPSPAGNIPGTAYLLPPVDMFTALACCYTPSCDTQIIDLTMSEMQEIKNVACGTQYTKYDPAAGYPFWAYIVGRSVEDSLLSVSPSPLCGNVCTLTLSALVHNGVPPYTVTHPWATGSATAGSYSTTTCTDLGLITLALTIPNCPSTCSGGTLSVPPPTITDACGATVSGLTGTTVTVIPTPVAIATPSSEIICSGTDVNIALTSCVTGTTYSWTGTDGTSGTSSTINSSPTNTGTTPITVTYTITPSAGGCSGTPITDTVTVNPIPVIAVATPIAICSSSGSATLTASGATTYAWMPSTGLSAITGATVTANPTETTTYTISGTARGCAGITKVTVTVNQTPTIIVATPAAICSGSGSAALTASGAATYNWTPSTGLSAITGVTVTANPITTTTYTVSGTTNGCTNTTTVTVTVNPTPTITVATPAAICSGSGSVTLSASGATTYAWTPSTGLSAITGATVIANPIITTTYTVSGTTSGCTGSAPVTVTVNSIPIVSAATPAAICSGSVGTTLIASGAITYTWAPSTGLSAITGATVTANPPTTTTYTVNGININGCQGTTTVTVTVNPKPVVAVNTPLPICINASATLAVHGAKSYTWTPSASLSSATDSIVTANPTVTTTYSVIGTNGAGCSDTSTITVTVNPKPVLIAPIPPAICYGSTAALKVSGASTYIWTPSTALSSTSGDSITANPTATTTYTVTGTDVNGCVNTNMVAVIVNPKVILAAVVTPTPICSGGNATLVASGANTYTWTPSTGLNNTTGFKVTASPTITTTYTITGTSLSGCTGATTVTVAVIPIPSLVVNTPAPICSGTSATLTVNGAAEYSWKPASGLSSATDSIVTATPTITTTYTVIGVSIGICSDTAKVIVKVHSKPSVVVNTPSPICIGATAALTVRGAKSYTWTPIATLSSATDSIVTADPIITTTYTVIGTNGAGCSDTTTVTVTVNPKPVLNVPLLPAICEGSSVVLAVSGANTYTWTPVTGLSNTTGNSITANPTTSTTYTVTGINGNGCINTATVGVTVNSNPILAVSAPALICNGNTTILSASGANTYTWSPSTGLNSIIGASVTANPTVTTTFTVTGMSSSGCTSVTTTAVTVNSNPSLIVNTPTPICYGASTTLIVSGATSYSWTPSTNLSSVSGSTVTANPTITTTYTIVGTNAAGCSDTASVSVTVVSNPNVSITSSAPSICTGTNATLTAKGATSYIWTPSTGLSSTTGSIITANPTATTTYSVTGTNSSGCSATASIPVTVNPNPVLNVTPIAPAICVGSNTILTVNGAKSYNWTPSTSLSSATDSIVTADPTVATTYTVTGINSAGCSGTATAIVTIKPNLILHVTPSSPSICAGTNTIMQVSGGTYYTWTPVTGLSSSTDSIVTTNPAATTTYTVTGTNSSGCSGVAKAVVTINPLATLQVIPTNPSICPGNSTVLRASGAASYVWIPSASLSSATDSIVTATPIVTTTYTVIGTTAKGCSDSSSAVITVNPTPLISVMPRAPFICNGANVTLRVTGAKTYMWSPSTGCSSTSDSVVTADPAINTTYTIIGTNSYGCKDSTNVPVTINSNPRLSVVPLQPAICVGDSITMTATGAASYSWTPSTGLNSATDSVVIANPITKTTYTVTGINAAGCSGKDSVTVLVNKLPQISVTTPSPDICTGTSTILTASGANSYSWTPSAGLSTTSGTSVTANPTITTSYTINAVDANGCTGSTIISIKVNPIPTVVVTGSPPICAEQKATLTAKGALNYQWTPSTALSATSGATVTADPTDSITYHVIGIDSNGCADSNSVTLDVYSLPVVSLSGLKPFYCVSAAQAQLTGLPDGGTYAGNSVNGNIFNPAEAGVGGPYKVTYTYTNSNGCTNSASLPVTILALPIIVISPNNPVLCAGNPIPLTASGANTYEWSPPDGLSDTTGNSVTANPTVTTAYMIMGVTDSGCAGVTTVTVFVDSMPQASFASQVPNICTPGDIQFINRSTGAASYSWDFGDGTTSNDQNPVHTFDKAGIYSVTLTAINADGCENVISNPVTITAGEYPVKVANAFLPGTNGVNGYIIPEIICTNLSHYVFRVYNRWGQLLYQTDDPSEGWDGRYNGQIEPVDVYDYYIEFNCGDCNVFKKGNITLLK